MILSLAFAYAAFSGNSQSQLYFAPKADVLIAVSQVPFGREPDKVFVINTKTGKIDKWFMPPEGVGVDGIVCSSDGSAIAFQSKDAVYVYGAADGKKRCQVDDISLNIALSADGKKLYAAVKYYESSSGDVKVFSAETGKEIRTAALNGSDVDISPDGSTLAVAGVHDGVIYLCDPDTLAVKDRIKTSANSLASIAYSIDGRYLVGTGAARAGKDLIGGTVDVYDLQEHKMARSFQLHPYRFFIGGRFLQTGKVLQLTSMSAGFEGDGMDPEITPFNVTLEKFADDFPGDWLYSPDGKIAAEFSADKAAVLLENVETGEITSLKLR